jgi:hypothetical protein
LRRPPAPGGGAPRPGGAYPPPGVGRPGFSPPPPPPRSHVTPAPACTSEPFNALTPAGLRHDPDAPGNHTPALFHQLPGQTIPAIVQHYVERPVSAPWHCATYFCTANTSSPRRGAAEPSKGVSGIHPGYSCKEGGRVEDRLLLEFPCTPTRTRSV